LQPNNRLVLLEDNFIPQWYWNLKWITSYV
jgi:hypothetical protein